MYEFCDPNWREPDECEILVCELKDKLRRSIKKEFEEKIEQLEKENAELQDVKKNWQELKKQLKESKARFEEKKRMLEQNVRYERIQTLLKSVAEPYYIVSYSNRIPVYGDKCEKCDENRRIAFYSPSGVKYIQNCICKKCYYEYQVTEGKLFQLRFSYDGKVYPVVHFDISEDEISEITVVQFSDDKPYELIDKYKAAFKSKENAQKYAKYLTELSRVEFLKKSMK